MPGEGGSTVKRRCAGSGGQAVAVALLGIVSATGCVALRENVTYGGGRVPFPGYSVEYVEATPAPGTVLVEGAEASVRVRVRYSLMVAEKGRLQMQIHDDRGRSLPVDVSVKEVSRTATDLAELTHRFVVPKGQMAVAAYVFVIPDGEQGIKGEVRIRYPVSRQERK
jgi:hypothetical protein